MATPSVAFRPAAAATGAATSRRVRMTSVAGSSEPRERRAPPRLLAPPVPATQHSGRPDELVGHTNSGPLAREVREGVVDVDRPLVAGVVTAQPVVEPEAVEVGRGTDLENDVALAAAVRRAGR